MLGTDGALQTSTTRSETKLRVEHLKKCPFATPLVAQRGQEGDQVPISDEAGIELPQEPEDRTAQPSLLQSTGPNSGPTDLPQLSGPCPRGPGHVLCAEAGAPRSEDAAVKYNPIMLLAWNFPEQAPETHWEKEENAQPSVGFPLERNQTKSLVGSFQKT